MIYVDLDIRSVFSNLAKQTPASAMPHHRSKKLGVISGDIQPGDPKSPWKMDEYDPVDPSCR